MHISDMLRIYKLSDMLGTSISTKCSFERNIIKDGFLIISPDMGITIGSLLQMTLECNINNQQNGCDCKMMIFSSIKFKSYHKIDKSLSKLIVM